jgi:ribosomal protein L11 methyltransferase
MKRMPLWKISITTTPEAEDAIMELVQRVCLEQALSYTDAQTREVAVSAYLRRKPDHCRARLLQGLERIRRVGLKVGGGKVSLRKVRLRDWAESWKRHFKPIEIGTRLLLKPGWSKRRARKGQAVVILDPGLSFGTGQHPTTAFCLEQLVACRAHGRRQAFLDIGTGSGILAIAAAKLGYSPIDAFDFDSEAVRVARGNARRNGVLGKMWIHRDDLTRQPLRSARKHDLVCANLISDLLASECGRIVGRLQARGTLVLAGILNTEFSSVARIYRKAGLKLVASRSEKEWRSGAFVFKRHRGSRASAKSNFRIGRDAVLRVQAARSAALPPYRK